MSIFIILAVLLGGFTLFSALTLGITHLRREHYQGYVQAQQMGWLLLILLSGLQLAHVLWLLGQADFLHTPFYQVFLFASAPLFYWSSRPLLQAETSPAWRQLWHGLPVLLAPLLPLKLALPLAFALGLGYLAWLAYRAYLLRHCRECCQREMVLLATAWLLAVGMGMLGLAAPWLAETLFFSLY
ncbi:MAG: AraC family transcriptional regulator, partial [Thiothrix sp.]